VCAEKKKMHTRWGCACELLEDSRRNTSTPGPSLASGGVWADRPVPVDPGTPLVGCPQLPRGSSTLSLSLCLTAASPTAEQEQFFDHSIWTALAAASECYPEPVPEPAAVPVDEPAEGVVAGELPG
jgi:hypothetical protein